MENRKNTIDTLIERGKQNGKLTTKEIKTVLFRLPAFFQDYGQSSPDKTPEQTIPVPAPEVPIPIQPKE